jgi:chromosome segregation ATPase
MRDSQITRLEEGTTDLKRRLGECVDERDSARKQVIETEGRMSEFERGREEALQKLQASEKRAQDSADTVLVLERDLREVGGKLSETETSLKETEVKLGESEGRASGAERGLEEMRRRIEEKEARLKEVEGRLEESEASLKETGSSLQVMSHEPRAFRSLNVHLRFLSSRSHPDF